MIIFFKPKVRVFIFLVVTLCICACDENQNNGQLDAIAHEKVNQLHRQIAKDLPGNEPPRYYGLDDESLYKLLSITEKNHLVLDNKKEIILAGLNCELDSINQYLTSMVEGLDNTTRLAVEYTGLKSGDLEYAYVWVVSFYGEKLTANSLHNLNEALMTTSYCSAVEQQSHKYYERYLGLEKIGQVLKEYRSNLK